MEKLTNELIALQLFVKEQLFIIKNSCNHFHNILRLFHVLTSFRFTTSELWCAIITYKHGIYEFSHELPNDLRLRILGN